MNKTKQELTSQILDEQDRFDAALRNLSIDCFEFTAYRELLNHLLELPNDSITPYSIFSYTLDRMIADLSNLRNAHLKLQSIQSKLLQFSQE